MSGLRIELGGEQPAFAAISLLADKLAHKVPLWRMVGEELAQQTNYRFETSTGPEGQKWPQSWRVKMGLGGGPTLVDSGILKTSMTLNVNEQGGEFGSPMEYAATHQFGDVIKAKTSKGLRFKFKAKGANRDAWVTKQSVVIPARPFLGINEENAQRLLDIAEGYLAAGVFE
jgi:phage virion morphogenesis protein